MLHSSYAIVDLLLRFTALISFLNYASLIPQTAGLIGINGLIPLFVSVKKIQKRCTRMRRGKHKVVDWLTPNTLYYVLLKLVQFRFSSRDLDANMFMALYIDTTVAALTIIYPHSILFCYLYWSLLGWKCVFDDFMQFPFDNLLLESQLYAGLLALLPDAMSKSLGMWQLRLLLLRTIFGGAMKRYKCSNRTSKWTAASLLRFREVDITSYLLQQPLPSHLAICLGTYFPVELHALNVLYYYVGILLELVLPWFVLLGYNSVNRAIVGCYTIQLIVGRVLMGHYGWTPLLSLTLCLSLLQDRDMPWLLQWVYSCIARPPPLSPLSEIVAALLSVVSTSAVSMYSRDIALRVLSSYAVGYFLHLLFFTIQLVALLNIFTSTNSTANTTTEDDGIDEAILLQLPDWLYQLYERAVVLHYIARVFYCLGSDYSSLYPHRRAVAVPTDPRVRREICISVSADKLLWREIDFAFKPGSEYLWPKRGLRVDIDGGWSCIYHIPRLDWSMWFLPLQKTEACYPRWLWVLLIEILERNRDVLSLLHWNIGRILNLLVYDLSMDCKTDGGGLNLFEIRKRTWLRVCTKKYLKNTKKLLKDKQPEISSGVSSEEDNVGAYWVTSEEEELVPPVQLDQLYPILDGYGAVAEDRPLSPINLTCKED